MKAGRFLLLLILFFSSLSAVAQRKKVDIKGTVVEQGTSTPVEQATVRLLSVKDSTFIGGVASEQNGNFTLKSVPPGNYLLHISFIGYDPLYQPLNITGNTHPVNIGKMELSDGAILLSEAVVMGKAPEVTVRNDTIEYNADSYKVTEGSMLEDLLKKMPGVEVDEEGKVTVNGKEIKKVLVDGKEFFSDDPKVASKNLPSNMIDKVQVLDRLSEMARLTGFDDGDEEAVINLTIKPGMKEGWVGNAYAGYGSKDRYEGNMMLNRMVNNDRYTLLGGLNNTNNMGFSDMGGSMFQGMGGGGGRGRGGSGSFGGGNGITSSGNIGFDFSKEFNKKLTLSGNARFSHSDNEANTLTSQQNIQQETMYENSSSFRNNKSDNVGANFRLEWKPDDKTTLLFRPNFSYSKNEQRSNSHSTEMDIDRDTISIEKQTTFYSGEGYNVDGRLEFSRKLNDEGRIFSASISGGLNDKYQNGKNDVETFYSLKEDELRDEKIRNDIKGYNYRAYVSWVEPLGRNNFIQLTYNINSQQQESLKNVYKPDKNGQYTVIDSTQTQNYRNDFLNQRASVSFKSIREKFNYTIGFNVDPSNSTSKNFIGDSILSNVKQNVVNFSPTAQFRYNFSKQSNLRIDYNGRTSQPSVEQLQPVADYSNPKNVVIGNPDLKPRYNNSLFLTYQTFKPQSQFALRTMLNGQYTVNDIIGYVINENDNTGKRTTTYKNINGNYNGSAMVMINTPLKNRKFTFNSMSRATYSKSNTIIGDKELDGLGQEIIVDTKNKNTDLLFMERAGFDFRSTYIDLGINGSIQYRKTRNTAEADNNQDIFNYTLGGRTTLYLPANIKIESDVNWSTNSGYTDGFELNEVLWNASASKSFLKGNQATLRIKIYDILQQRSNISRSITANYTRDSEYNTLSSYFMVHFIYRFSIFKGGANMNDVQNRSRGGFRGAGGPPNAFF
ncbi:TonB-dependent receptor [Parabacteroides sp. 52]|uniref:TonB-dependent receptor n=1 Tax=unclassified Parabacteroides TaxID=2649774 RepID=UPI0013D88AB1|nr:MULTISPECIES: TonB-dependent receptor [unclassified Parabacteroides]MDH6535458.1 hypothetical protein [Parabacteroides sp. PM5-20]NDV56100.1 TonB-dependent receptor [Parabacteroides sp. 52]